MEIQKTWLAPTAIGLLLPALALSGERAETFDFSRAGDGVIGGRNPAVIRTISPYGRFRGMPGLRHTGMHRIQFSQYGCRLRPSSRICGYKLDKLTTP